MKGERLFQLLGLIDEDLIEEAGTASSSAASKRRNHSFRGLAAACIAIACVGGAVWMLQDGLYLGGASMSIPGESAGNGIAHDTEPQALERTTFMSYAGPVFPLTLTEEIDGITAERTTVWDFTPKTREDGSTYLWGSTVTDSYLLTNSTTGDILAMASYPVAGSLADLPETKPTITLNGTSQETTLQAGAYAGSFTDAGLEDGSTWNLYFPDSWLDYKTLLEDGSYFTNVFDSLPPLDHSVAVYEFSNYVLPANVPNAATLAMEFTIDPEVTTILTYGINGMGWDDNSGWRQFDFFVPSINRKEPERKLIIVLGEDIGNYTIQGYKDGGCDPGEELDGLSCTVTQYETTLGAVMESLCHNYQDSYTKQWQQDQGTETDLFDIVSLDLFVEKASELMTQYGILAGEHMTDRYSDGRLSSIISETLTQERILYWSFPVTIPAGSNVEISVTLNKKPSFDYGCSGSENVGLQGYDFVTQLGSNLDFNHQTAALINTENIEIINQNFGFDLENGITQVSLDPDTEHYYLEIREKNQQHTH